MKVDKSTKEDAKDGHGKEEIRKEEKSTKEGWRPKERNKKKRM